MAYCVPLGIPHSRFLSWNEDDQDKALAFQREKAKICQGCGTRLEEWKSDRWAYQPEAYKCRGCELTEQFRESIPTDEKGIKVVLTTKDPEDIEDFGWGQDLNPMTQRAHEEARLNALSNL